MQDEDLQRGKGEGATVQSRPGVLVSEGAIAAPRRQRKFTSRCNLHALWTRPWLLAPVLQPRDSVGVTLWPQSAEPVAHIPSPTTCTAARAASERVRGAQQTLGVGYSWMD